MVQAQTRSKAVVLIPTYNEKVNISRIIPAVLAAAPVDIVIIDDNSPDGTGVIADEWASREPRVSVLHRKEKNGLGRAYIAGMRLALDAGYEKICHMDADLSHPADRLSALLEVSTRADVVIGSRYVKGGGTRNWPLRRQLISRSGSFYARTVLGVNIRDMTAGMKCFDRKVLETLGLETIRSDGYGFNVEMTYRSLRRGFTVEEVPIIFVERDEGYSKMSSSIVREAMLICWKLRFLSA